MNKAIKTSIEAQNEINVLRGFALATNSLKLKQGGNKSSHFTTFYDTRLHVANEEAQRRMKPYYSTDLVLACINNFLYKPTIRNDAIYCCNC